MLTRCLAAFAVVMTFAACGESLPQVPAVPVKKPAPSVTPSTAQAAEPSAKPATNR